MAKEFIYTKTKELGELNGNKVELGHYKVDGKKMDDKIYLVTYFTRRNGSADSSATAICSKADAKALAEILNKI